MEAVQGRPQKLSSVTRRAAVIVVPGAYGAGAKGDGNYDGKTEDAVLRLFSLSLPRYKACDSLWTLSHVYGLSLSPYLSSQLV